MQVYNSMSRQLIYKAIVAMPLLYSKCCISTVSVCMYRLPQVEVCYLITCSPDPGPGVTSDRHNDLLCTPGSYWRVSSRQRHSSQEVDWQRTETGQGL